MPFSRAVATICGWGTDEVGKRSPSVVGQLAEESLGLGLRESAHVAVSERGKMDSVEASPLSKAHKRVVDRYLDNIETCCAE